MKTWQRDERIWFRKEPGARWETGIYLQADTGPNAKGWHTVQDDGGFREKFYVPSRRIRDFAVKP